jgi:hypothetical protein
MASQYEIIEQCKAPLKDRLEKAVKLFPLSEIQPNNVYLSNASPTGKGLAAIGGFTAFGYIGMAVAHANLTIAISFAAVMICLGILVYLDGSRFCKTRKTPHRGSRRDS